MSGDTEGGQSVSAKKTVRRKTTARRAAGLATRVAEPDGAGTKRRGADLSILAVGCLVNQSAVSTELFRSNATFLEYDVVVWDPESTIHEYRSREYGAVFQGLPSLGDDASVRLKADVARRRDELTQMLDLGRTVVMFAPTPQSFYVGTGRTETSGTGRNAKETRIVAELSLFSAFPFKLKSVAAAGSKAELRAGEPFASFWKSTSDLLKYRASFEVEDAMPLMTIKGTDRMVGACLQRGKGFVLILPAPYWDSSLENSAKVAAESAETRLIAALRVLVDALRQETGDFKLPAWSDDYEMVGERSQRQQLASREAERDLVLRKIDEQKQILATRSQRKILFTGSGVALEGQTKNAFRALGFDVTDGAPGRDDFIATYGEEVAVVEVKGVTKSAAEKHAAQLEKWVAGYHEANDRQPKGILVVNTFSATPLAERPAVDFPDQMLPYCTGRKHALVTGVQLLGAWLEIEEHPERKHEVALSLIAAVGRWNRYTDWRSFLGVSPPSTAAVSGSG